MRRAALVLIVSSGLWILTRAESLTPPSATEPTESEGAQS